MHIVRPTNYGIPTTKPIGPAVVLSTQNRSPSNFGWMAESEARPPVQVEMAMPSISIEPIAVESDQSNSNANNSSFRTSLGAGIAYCTEPAPMIFQAVRLGGSAGSCVTQTVTNSLLAGIVDGLATFGSCTVGFFIGDGLGRLTRRLCR